MDPQSRALLELGRALRALGYAFTTVTPETQRIVNARPENARAATLRDVFGWSRPFDEKAVPSAIVSLLRDAGALVSIDDGFRSDVRFSTLGKHLFVHSAYPTYGVSDVFFGPDTVRFCALVDRVLARGPRVRRLIDVGCGSGAGGIMAARYADEVVLSDVNERAVRFAAVNAALAGLERVATIESDLFARVDGVVDCVIANPPYMRDTLGRAYRDGGGDHGAALAIRILEEALARLTPNGKLVLYTGASIIDGEDVFFRAAKPILARAAVSFRYDEIDPDVFGDELERSGYERVERIAAVSLVVSKG